MDINMDSSKITRAVMFVVLLTQGVICSNTTDGDSRVIVKNSIAYHFVKNVKSVEMDLFVTRRIDVAPMLQGIDKIQHIHQRVLSLCRRIPSMLVQSSKPTNISAPPPPGLKATMYLVPTYRSVTRSEAEGVCRSKNYQLPEIYDNREMIELNILLLRFNISYVHAGIRWDFEENIHKFISTGLPFWYAFQRQLYRYDPSLPSKWDTIEWNKVAARSEARFVYMPDGSIGAFLENNVMSSQYQFRRDYWNWETNYSPFVAKSVICQDRWDGTPILSVDTPEPWKLDKHSIPYSDVRKPSKVRGKAKRAARPDLPGGPDKTTTRKPYQEKLAPMHSTPLEEFCYSVGNHLGETAIRSRDRLTNLLSQVDISINNYIDDRDITKRDTMDVDLRYNNTASRVPRDLATVIFKTGLKGIWTLIGFIDKIRTKRRLGKIEKTLDKHGQDISKLSQEIADHSIAINHLALVTDELNKRLDSLTYKVTELESRLGSLGTEVRTQQLLLLIDSLSGRTDQALTFAFEKLDNVIQHALVGQASSHILPISKLEELQVEINKYSTSIIDTAYERMKATVVSDPMSSTSLMCIINLSAVSRKTRELVRLISIPWYEKSFAMVPALDYNMVLLDQEMGYYTIVDPSEENGCLSDRCLTSNPAVQISSPSCGIPQFFDRHLEACSSTDIISNGMFLKQLISDGIIFSIRDESDAQVFCNLQMSKTNKLRGSGTINLPPGCTLVVTDPTGTVTKIDSSPLSQMIETQPLDLIPYGPGEIFKPSDKHYVNGTSSLVRMINSHLEEINRKLSDTKEDVAEQNLYVIIIGSLLGFTTLFCVILAALLFRYSRRFRKHVRKMAEELKAGLTEAHQKFLPFQPEQKVVAQVAEDLETELLVSHRALVPYKVNARPIPNPIRLPSLPVTKAPVAPASMGRQSSLNSLFHNLANIEDKLLMCECQNESLSYAGCVTPSSTREQVGGTSEVSIDDQAILPPPVPPKPSFGLLSPEFLNSRAGRNEDPDHIPPAMALLPYPKPMVGARPKGPHQRKPKSQK